MENVNVISRNFTKIQSENGVNGKYVIKCRLHDDCKNGHEDFSITYEYLEEDRDHRYYECGGGCGSDLYKIFPEFEMICKLHLSDFRGVPMYAVENGMYHLQNSDKGIAMSYLRINEEEYNILKNIDDKVCFKCALHDLGIVKRWKEEADKCIEWLINGEEIEFVSKGGRLYNIDITDEEMNEYNKLKSRNYFSSEERYNRDFEKYSQLIEKSYNEKKTHLHDKYQEELKKNDAKRNINISILNKSQEFDTRDIKKLFESYYIIVIDSKMKLCFWSDNGFISSDEEKIKEIAKSYGIIC